MADILRRRFCDNLCFIKAAETVVLRGSAERGTRDNESWRGTLDNEQKVILMSSAFDGTLKLVGCLSNKSFVSLRARSSVG
jgi:hypothetical protein